MPLVLKAASQKRGSLVAVIPESLDLKEMTSEVFGACRCKSWSGNQTRFSRI